MTDVLTWLWESFHNVYIHQIIACFKRITILFVNDTSIQLGGRKTECPRPLLILHEFLLYDPKGWRRGFFNRCALASIPFPWLCYFSHYILFFIELKTQGLGKITSIPLQRKLLYIVSNYKNVTCHTFNCFVFHSSCPVRSHLTTRTFTHSFVGFPAICVAFYHLAVLECNDIVAGFYGFPTE